MTGFTWAAPELIFLGANTGLLTGIFFRLGGLGRGHDDHARRLDKLETKMEI